MVSAQTPFPFSREGATGSSECSATVVRLLAQTRARQVFCASNGYAPINYTILRGESCSIRSVSRLIGGLSLFAAGRFASNVRRAAGGGFAGHIHRPDLPLPGHLPVATRKEITLVWRCRRPPAGIGKDRQLRDVI